MKTHEEKPDGGEAYLLYGGSHCASAPAGGFPRSPAYDSGGLVSNALLFPLYMSEDCPLYVRRNSPRTRTTYYGPHRPPLGQFAFSTHSLAACEC